MGRRLRLLLMLILLLTVLASCNDPEENLESEESAGERDMIEDDEEEKELTDSEDGEPQQQENEDMDLNEQDEEDNEEDKEEPPVLSLEEIEERYQGESPQEWGENVTGVKTRMQTEEPIAALTFDACGGPNGRGYDEALIDYLEELEIPATIFISGDWLDHNPEKAIKLAENPLFDIANHGTNHKPLSVNGKSAYGISGTESIEEVYEEVRSNHLAIEEVTGVRSEFFRSGTAYYDEIAVKITQDLGETVVNYNVLGDAGATFSTEQIYNSMMQAEPGAIMLFHMNHPQSDVAEGVRRGVEALTEAGFEFILLKDYVDLLQ